MDKPEKNPWTRLKREVVYDNPWITVHHDDVIAPTGKSGIYGTVHYKNFALGIIALDAQRNIWLVGQHRYPINVYSWEIPEGGGPVDEEPLPAAQRELKEEAGLVADNWKEIQRLHLSNSVSDEVGIIYLATGLTYTDVEPDETEVLDIRKIPFKEAEQMLSSGEITDTMSVIGILKVRQMLDLNLI